MNSLLMQTTLFPVLVAYASITLQGPEKSLFPRIKVTFTRTGILDCRLNLSCKEAEQITLGNIEIDKLRKVFTVLDYFHLYNVQTLGISTVISVVQYQPGRAAISAGTEKTSPFA